MKVSVNAPRFYHVSGHDKILFLKHLTIMLEAGIPLHDALETIQEQSDAAALRYVALLAGKDLSDGRPMSSTLAKFPKFFDAFFVSVVRVGESSGTLSDSLQYLATQMEKSQLIEGRVRAALIYPAIIFSGAIGVAVYLTFFLLPQLLPLFTSLAIQLPFTTRVMLGLAIGLRTYWAFIMGAIAVVVIGIGVLWHFVYRVRYVCHQVILWLPVVGLLIREVELSRMSRILGTLLTSGVKIVSALHVTADSCNNLVYRERLQEIARAVERGENVGAQLIKYPHLFTRTAVSMVAVGERTGGLSRSLLSLAEFEEHEVESLTGNLTTLIEPIILVLVGVMVGFVALSIITPIYQLTQGLSR